MQVFIDSANLDEIREALSWGIVDGITTNPSLIKKAVEYFKAKGKQYSMADYITEILALAGSNRPVSLEVISTTTDAMIEEARLLYHKFNPVAHNVVIKIPVNPDGGKRARDFDGLKAIKALESEGIPVNVTLVMTPEQAVLAAKCGAHYVSPFVGRLDDLLRKRAGLSFNKEDYYPADGFIVGDQLLEDNGLLSGIHMLRIIKDIFDNYGFGTKIIAASVRNARQVREIMELGVDIATIPFDVLRQMIVHEKTDEGVQLFEADVVPEYRELFGR
ncbi:transaldolase [Coprothermobacteraceae bacterium]|nr:transaldolase [Coprothermobacteraceae bacterium]